MLSNEGLHVRFAYILKFQLRHLPARGCQHGSDSRGRSESSGGRPVSHVSYTAGCINLTTVVSSSVATTARALLDVVTVSTARCASSLVSYESVC